jgi:hypothetical protein
MSKCTNQHFFAGYLRFTMYMYIHNNIQIHVPVFFHGKDFSVIPCPKVPMYQYIPGSFSFYWTPFFLLGHHSLERTRFLEKPNNFSLGIEDGLRIIGSLPDLFRGTHLLHIVGHSIICIYIYTVHIYIYHYIIHWLVTLFLMHKPHRPNDHHIVLLIASRPSKYRNRPRDMFQPVSPIYTHNIYVWSISPMYTRYCWVEVQTSLGFVSCTRF